MSRYDFNGSTEQKNDLQLTVGPMTAVRGTIDRVIPTGPGKFGQSLGVVFRDAQLLDGVMMLRKDTKGSDREKAKLFSWEQLLGETPDSSDAAPEVFSESFRDTYHYELVEAVLEEAGDEPVSIPDFVTWESGGAKPSASAKRLAKLTTNLGMDAVLSDDDINAWLDTNADLRSDLVGVEVDYFKQVRPGEEYEYHRPTLVNVETGAEFTISAALTPTAPAAEAPVTDGGATTAATATEPETASEPADAAGFPHPVEEFVNFMVNFEVEDDATILDELYVNADDAGTPLTTAMVDSVGEDAILQAIKERR